MTRADISGKMETLSKLLERFHSKGDKVLLFSFSTQMLDLLQAYMKSKGYSHLYVLPFPLPIPLIPLIVWQVVDTDTDK